MNMQTFRQGIISAPQLASELNFLAYNTFTNTVELVITGQPVIVTAAHKTADYLIKESESQASAWGPFQWNFAWGAEPTNPVYSLYWDINVATGAVTRGYTYYTPLALAEPVTPLEGQHWFDNVTSTMKVWRGTGWEPVIRVFAGTLDTETNTIAHVDLGSQVNNFDECEPGYIVLSGDHKGVKTASGVFLTSTTPLYIRSASMTSDFVLETLSRDVIASEAIPGFRVIAISTAGHVQLANSSDPNKTPIGLADRDAAVGEPLRVVNFGQLYNEQWNWDLNSGRSLYANINGELLQGSALTGYYKVAEIIDAHTIVLNLEGLAQGAGPVGPLGPTGVQGPTGPAGSDGATGPTGVQGPTGPVGLTGVAGPTGPAGSGGAGGAWAVWWADNTEQTLTPPTGPTSAPTFVGFDMGGPTGAVLSIHEGSAIAPASLQNTAPGYYNAFAPVETGLYMLTFEAYKLNGGTPSFTSGLINVRVTDMTGDPGQVWSTFASYTRYQPSISYYNVSTIIPSQGTIGTGEFGQWVQAELVVALDASKTYLLEWAHYGDSTFQNLDFRTKKLTAVYLGPAVPAPIAPFMTILGNDPLNSNFTAECLVPPNVNNFNLTILLDAAEPSGTYIVRNANTLVTLDLGTVIIHTNGIQTLLSIDSTIAPFYGTLTPGTNLELVWPDTIQSLSLEIPSCGF